MADDSRLGFDGKLQIRDADDAFVKVQGIIAKASGQQTARFQLQLQTQRATIRLQPDEAEFLIELMRLGLASRLPG